VPVIAFVHVVLETVEGKVNVCVLLRRFETTNTFSEPSSFVNAHTSGVVYDTKAPRLIAALAFLK